MDDLDLYKLLPNMNKQFSVILGIAHASFHSFLTIPEPVYKG